MSAQKPLTVLPVTLIMIPVSVLGLTMTLSALDARKVRQENRELRARLAAVDDRCRSVDLPPPENTFLGVNRTDGVAGRPLGCDYIEQSFISTFQACNHPHPKAGNRTLMICSETGEWLVAIGEGAGNRADWSGKNAVADCVPPVRYPPVTEGAGNVILREKK